MLKIFDNFDIFENFENLGNFGNIGNFETEKKIEILKLKKNEKKLDKLVNWVLHGDFANQSKHNEFCRVYILVPNFNI